MNEKELKELENDNEYLQAKYLEFINEIELNKKISFEEWKKGFINGIRAYWDLEKNKNIKEITVYEYILKANLLEDFLKSWHYIPLLIKDLQYYTEEVGIWSYCLEDKSEIEDLSKVVLVSDIEGNKRFFELEPTETF